MVSDELTVHRSMLVKIRAATLTTRIARVIDVTGGGIVCARRIMVE